MVKYLFGVVFPAVGLFFTFAILWAAGKQNDAHQRFRPVEASVVHSRVTSSTSGTGSSRTRSYRPVITYRYSVDGNEYESNRYQFMGQGHSTYDSADQVADRFAKGTSITAFYDPSDPSVAVLDTTPVDTTALYIGAGIFWSVIAGMGVFFFARGLARRRRVEELTDNQRANHQPDTPLNQSGDPFAATVRLEVDRGREFERELAGH